MGQGSVAEAAKIYAKDRMFTGYGDYPDEKESTINVLNSIYQGYHDTFTDPSK